MILAKVQRRVLGGFRFVDAFSNATVQERIAVSSDQLDIRRGPNATYVVFGGRGFRDLTTQFEPDKNWPGESSFQIAVRPASRHYLPRTAQITMPRKPRELFKLPDEADQAAQSSSLVLEQVTLYPGPAAATEPNWAVVHVSVKGDTATGAGLPWAVLQLTKDADGKVLKTTLTDERGESLVAVPAATRTVNVNGEGKVEVVEIPATLTAYFDSGNFDAMKQADWLPDPDALQKDLNSKKKSDPVPVKIGRGTEQKFTVPIKL